MVTRVPKIRVESFMMMVAFELIGEVGVEVV